MSRSSSLTPPVFLRLLLAFLIAASFARGQQRDDARIAELRDQIQAMDGVVAATKNAAEKARLDVRLQRLREELGILESRQAIEARQRALTDNLRTSPLDSLRERLRSLDATVEEAEARVRDLSIRRKTVVAARDLLVTELEGLKNGPASGSARAVEVSELIYTRNEELRALALQREAAELQMELARESSVLRERIGKYEANTRPTLRVLFESFTHLADARKVIDRLGPLESNLEQSRQVSESALTLSQQKLAKFDEELALLEKQTGFFTSNAKVDRLLTLQRAQKKAVSDRLPFIAGQVEALKQAQQMLAQRRELVALELAVSEEQFTTLKAAYVQRLRWPVVALGALTLCYFGVSLLGLPLFFKNENLFLSRRLTRYFAVIIAVGVVAGFLFDDLSVVATTMGVVSAAVVISLQDVCTSVFGWFVIMVGSKFTIGDRLEVEETRGDVIDIQLLRTTLLEVNGWLGADQPTGRVILVPNNFIFKTKVFNYSHGHPFIWGKIDLTVSFCSAPEAATLFQRVLTEETKEEFAAAQTAALSIRRRYGVDDAVYQPRISSAIAGNDVAFTLFYVAHYRHYAAVRDRINARLIVELKRQGNIELAVQSLQLSHSNPLPQIANVKVV